MTLGSSRTTFHKEPEPLAVGKCEDFWTENRTQHVGALAGWHSDELFHADDGGSGKAYPANETKAVATAEETQAVARAEETQPESETEAEISTAQTKKTKKKSKKKPVAPSNGSSVLMDPSAMLRLGSAPEQLTKNEEASGDGNSTFVVGDETTSTVMEQDPSGHSKAANDSLLLEENKKSSSLDETACRSKDTTTGASERGEVGAVIEKSATVLSSTCESSDSITLLEALPAEKANEQADEKNNQHVRQPRTNTTNQTEESDEEDYPSGPQNAADADDAEMEYNPANGSSLARVGRRGHVPKSSPKSSPPRSSSKSSSLTHSRGSNSTTKPSGKKRADSTKLPNAPSSATRESRQRTRSAWTGMQPSFGATDRSNAGDAAGLRARGASAAAALSGGSGTSQLEPPEPPPAVTHRASLAAQQQHHMYMPTAASNAVQAQQAYQAHSQVNQASSTPEQLMYAQSETQQTGMVQPSLAAQPPVPPYLPSSVPGCELQLAPQLGMQYSAQQLTMHNQEVTQQHMAPITANTVVGASFATGNCVAQMQNDYTTNANAPQSSYGGCGAVNGHEAACAAYNPWPQQEQQQQYQVGASQEQSTNNGQADQQQCAQGWPSTSAHQQQAHTFHCAGVSSHQEQEAASSHQVQGNASSYQEGQSYATEFAGGGGCGVAEESNSGKSQHATTSGEHDRKSKKGKKAAENDAEEYEDRTHPLFGKILRGKVTSVHERETSFYGFMKFDGSEKFPKDAHFRSQDFRPRLDSVRELIPFYTDVEFEARVVWKQKNQKRERRMTARTCRIVGGIADKNSAQAGRGGNVVSSTSGMKMEQEAPASEPDAVDRLLARKRTAALAYDSPKKGSASQEQCGSAGGEPIKGDDTAANANDAAGKDEAFSSCASSSASPPSLPLIVADSTSGGTQKRDDWSPDFSEESEPCARREPKYRDGAEIQGKFSLREFERAASILSVKLRETFSMHKRARQMICPRAQQQPSSAVTDADEPQRNAESDGRVELYDKQFVSINKLVNEFDLTPEQTARFMRWMQEAIKCRAKLSESEESDTSAKHTAPPSEESWKEYNQAMDVFEQRFQEETAEIDRAVLLANSYPSPSS
ncbi:unnamed protein product [Amoebophrya sp. A25]|nr:unnamed protein product [Amoebophrya sp. A25]|eukprot:GSA25T00021570001.1